MFLFLVVSCFCTPLPPTPLNPRFPLQMSVEGQEAMQQVVQDAMMSISPLGGEGALEARGGDEGARGSVGGEGEGHGEEGEEGGGDGGGALERDASREQREEEWALRLAESEDAMVRCLALRLT